MGYFINNLKGTREGKIKRSKKEKRRG